ncbi:MAG: hypothetical protein IPL65_14105 [Lewinellaceae bacterium]|nr:hypothetical protein [Lewinellaceae bacterium]
MIIDNTKSWLQYYRIDKRPSSEREMLDNWNMWIILGAGKWRRWSRERKKEEMVSSIPINKIHAINGGNTPNTSLIYAMTGGYTIVSDNFKDMIFKEGSIYFNKIMVLQSLDDDDRKTGTELHDDIISRRAWVDPNLETELIEIENKSQFIAQLSEIRQSCFNNRILPFLHLEMHGFSDGISLRSGENILWRDILPAIRDINIASRNNLFISCCICFGGHIQFIININEPCPIRGFIAPMNDIYENDLLISFTAFFDTLLTTNDFERAINALNASNNSGVTFHHLNSEAFFDLVAQTSDDQFREERINLLTNQNWENDPNVRLIFDNIDTFREFVRESNDNITPQQFKSKEGDFFIMT